MNGVSSFDASQIAQHVAGTTMITASRRRIAADVTNNNAISSTDAAQIARFAVGLPPTGSPPAIPNTWKFFVPSATEPTFPVGASPTVRNYTDPIGVQTGQDYIGILIGEVSGNWTPSAARLAAAVGSGPERSVDVMLPQIVTGAYKDVVIPVSVNGAADKGIISYEFDLRYDPLVIQPQEYPVDVVGTVSRGLFVVTNTEESGLLRVVMYGAFPIDENGVLLNFRFTAVGVTGSVSPLSFERIIFNEGETGVTLTDGRVKLD